MLGVVRGMFWLIFQAAANDYLILLINQLIILKIQSMNCKMKCYGFPKPKVISLDCFFCPTTTSIPKDSSFTVMNEKEKQQILTFKKLEPANV